MMQWNNVRIARDTTNTPCGLFVRYGCLRIKTLAFAVPENQTPRIIQVRLNGQPVNASLESSGSRVLVTLSQEATINRGGKLEVTLV